MNMRPEETKEKLMNMGLITYRYVSISYMTINSDFIFFLKS